MKKTITATLLAILCAFIFCACNDNKENDPMNNNEQETVTIESLEGEWVGYEGKESEDRWSRRYFASIKDGTIKVEFEDWGPQSENGLWWFGSFNDVDDGSVISIGLESKDLEEQTRFVGSERLFKCGEDAIETLKIPSFEPNDVTNPNITFHRQGN